MKKDKKNMENGPNKQASPTKDPPRIKNNIHPPSKFEPREGKKYKPEMNFLKTSMIHNIPSQCIKLILLKIILLITLCHNEYLFVGKHHY